jgi:YHS domain-containing protein
MQEGKEAKDVVCGMIVEVTPDAINTTYRSLEFFFCSEDCRGTFRANPEEYYEKHEPPYTTKGFTAPRFGAAGSGGLENEPVPERHRKK